LENRQNGLGDEGADRAMPHPLNFWARTAPDYECLKTSISCRRYKSTYNANARETLLQYYYYQHSLFAQEISKEIQKHKTIYMDA